MQAQRGSQRDNQQDRSPVKAASENVDDSVALGQAKQLSDDVAGLGGVGKSIGSVSTTVGKSEKLRSLLTEIGDKLKTEKAGLTDAVAQLAEAIQKEEEDFETAVNEGREEVQVSIGCVSNWLE